MLLRDLAHDGDGRPGAILVDGREIERGSAAFAIARRARAVFAGQQPARHRRPDHQAELFLVEQWHDLAFQVAAGDRVVGLHRLEAGKALAVGYAQRLGDAPGLPVGNADIAHLAAGDEVVERPQRLVDRRHRVGAVQLVEIDMIGLQPLQAAIDRVHDVAARGAALVGALAHGAMDLGGDHDIRPLDAEIPERLAEQSLGGAEGVDVGGIEEVDAGGDRAGDNLIDALLVEAGDEAPLGVLAGVAEGHGAEAEFGDEHPRISELVVAHGAAPGGKC